LSVWHESRAISREACDQRKFRLGFDRHLISRRWSIQSAAIAFPSPVPVPLVLLLAGCCRRKKAKQNLLSVRVIAADNCELDGD
jgi:hypothetical protein